MTFDWTVNIGHLLTILGLISMGVGMYYAVKLSIAVLAVKLETLGGRLINVENDLRDINKVLSAVAVQDARLVTLDDRLNQQARSAEEHRKWTREQVTYLLRHVPHQPHDD